MFDGFIHNLYHIQSSCNESLYFNADDLTAPVTLRMPKVNEMIKNKGQWYSRPFFAFEGGYPGPYGGGVR